ncbi:MarR family transcriptional regulator [uncultured Paenibacillus sp.]|uniref:MarR family winged helix-turn-helix transcriptional regulator n=1 Tax=uncultured Paenibacillus sp. TaxID=227322 RepID=UPI002803D8C6|nr:MarR family transcriptional regulator [uncultured Paenibacillus sp.]
MLNKQERLSLLMSMQMTRFVVGYAKILDPELTAPQYLILQILSGAEQRNCSELAEMLEVSLPAVTNLANKLVAKGLIERVIPESDRRNVLLRITEAGQEVEARMVQKYEEMTRELWEDFSEEETDVLLRAFEKMLERFDPN